MAVVRHIRPQCLLHHGMLLYRILSKEPWDKFVVAIIMGASKRLPLLPAAIGLL